MISYPITLDGVTYKHIRVMSIKRSFDIYDGVNAGRVQALDMDRDVLGTFYNYACEIDSDDATPAEYDQFYEAISAPVDSHELTIPYAQTTLTFRTYVSNGTDELVAMLDDFNRWGALSFNFIAMAPQRRPT